VVSSLSKNGKVFAISMQIITSIAIHILFGGPGGGGVVY
jgi:hypothetical protein